MTDKQIIIDGIDVSGCEYYFDGKCRCMDASIMQDFYLCPQCNNNPNCYYKNWERKEQECEKLKEGYSELTDIVSPYMDDFTGYNEELGGFDIVLCVKELMEQLDQLKAENKELKDLNTRLDNQRETYWKGYQKLEQTLTEIKALAIVLKNICPEFIKDGNDSMKAINEILQKTSECEDINDTAN